MTKSSICIFLSIVVATVADRVQPFQSVSLRKYELGSYDEMCAAHRWEVPERYNIARDVCDKHDRGPARDGLGGLARGTSAG